MVLITVHSGMSTPKGLALCYISWCRHQMETFSALLTQSPVNSPHKCQWRGALMFYLICAWINAWVNIREAGDLRRCRAHYDAIVMHCDIFCTSNTHKFFCILEGWRGLYLIRPFGKISEVWIKIHQLWYKKWIWTYRVQMAANLSRVPCVYSIKIDAWWWVGWSINYNTITTN